MASVDLEAIAAFLNPSLQQNLGGNVVVETFQLESCLVIKLLANQVLPQPVVIETIQTDLSLFQLNGIRIIRVSNWYQIELADDPILLWSHDITKYDQIDMVKSFQSNSEIYTPVVKSESRFGIIHILLMLLLVAIASTVGALIKLSNSNNFAVVDSETVPIPNPAKTTPKPTVITEKNNLNPAKEPEIIVPKETQKDFQAIPNLPVFAARSNAAPTKTEITLEQYNRINIGMAIAEVEQIVGISGRIIYDNRTGEVASQLYSWKNPAGSNAIIEFRDGKVESKNQAGL
jgi:hypothetical protein